MKSLSRLAFSFLAGACCFAASAFAQDAAAPAAPAAPPEAATPAPRGDEWWVGRQKGFNEQVKQHQGNVDLVFIGDSITDGWDDGEAKSVWEKFYGQRKTLNLGIGGDRTQHVLYRLQNGNLEGITPKLAVVMIGTNNSGNDAPENIALGVTEIVKTLREKTPTTKILLLATFPRGETPDNPQRQTNEKSNDIVAKLADGEYVFFEDIGPRFLEADGKLSKEVMPDLLHLNQKSYTTWAESIEPMVKKLLGET